MRYFNQFATITIVTVGHSLELKQLKQVKWTASEVFWKASSVPTSSSSMCQSPYSLPYLGCKYELVLTVI